MAKEPKKFEYDSDFPENVNPTEENRRKFSEDRAKERKQLEKDADNAVDNEDRV